jgi:hypothetical protein
MMLCMTFELVEMLLSIFKLALTEISVYCFLSTFMISCAFEINSFIATDILHISVLYNMKF